MSRPRLLAVIRRTPDAPPGERLVRLPDGRRLAYLDVGDADGHAVIYLHGAPSSKLEAAFFGLDRAARRAGVRLLAVDRPGIGGSDPQPGRTLLDWPADVTALADALDLQAFAVLGCSVGGASALACLHRPDGRLTGVGIVSGIGPADVPGLQVGRSPDVARVFRWAATRPRLAAAMLRGMRLGTRQPHRMLASAGRGMPAADRSAAAGPRAASAFAAFLADALRQGPAGALEDLRLAALPWGFTPTSTAVPVRIWHGVADRNAPVQSARWLAERIAHAEVSISPAEGHISLLARHGEDILAAVRR